MNAGPRRNADAVAVPVVLAGATAVVLLACWSIVRTYTPVPWFDMWRGDLGFLRDVEDGRYGRWWAQENEHRIVLTRALFWIDAHAFSAQSWPLLVFNVLAAAAIAATLVKAFLTLEPASSRSTRRVVAALVVASSFSSVQNENFAWAYQSQFFLAQLLPLAALLALSSASRDGSRSAFALSCALGVLSAMTMANGVLALPALLVYACVVRMRRELIFVLLVLTLIVEAAYFVDFHATPPHGATADGGWRPSEIVLFFLCYLGNPAHFVPWPPVQGVRGTALLGLAFVALASHAALRSFRLHRDPLRLGLVVFMVFLSTSAAATAVGRSVLGPEGAFASRYATPTLMGWNVLLILESRVIEQFARLRPIAFAAAAIALILIVLRVQWHMNDWTVSDPRRQALVGLALAMGVHDREQIATTYPYVDEVASNAAWAASRRLSFFRSEPYAAAHAELGRQDGRQTPSARCAGRIDRVSGIRDDARFLRIEGWIADPAERVPRTVRLVDTQGTLAGFAVAGFDRAKAFGSEPPRPIERAAFRGYVRAVDAGSPIVVIADDRSCAFAGVVPAAPETRATDKL